MIGFIIWSLFGVFIIGLGIKDMFSKNPVGFWANTETIKVKDVKDYNRASGLLFIIYGIIFVILGIPLLEGQNTPYILLSVIGVMQCHLLKKVIRKNIFNNPRTWCT